jgi:hypothetical protein
MKLRCRIQIPMLSHFGFPDLDDERSKTMEIARNGRPKLGPQTGKHSFTHGWL